MKSVTVARNYAEALFAAGDEFGPLLDAVAGAVQADERIATALESPRVSKAAKSQMKRRASSSGSCKPWCGGDGRDSWLRSHSSIKFCWMRSSTGCMPA